MGERAAVGEERAAGVEVGPDGLARCPWGGGPDDYRAYHDGEWGVPLRGDDALFERMTLEAFQSGLSWLTILRKRPAFRAAFADFSIAAVAAFGEADRARLLADAGIVRNRAKVDAAITNARAARGLLEADGDGALDRLLWSFAPPAGPPPRVMGDLPAATPASTALARALKGFGFTFVGPTTMYALQQAVGMVDDHLVGCWRRGQAG